MPAPATTRAIVIKAQGKAAVEEVSTPKLRDEYILVKTTAVALNPTDWKHIDSPSPVGVPGARVGCDYAGVVVEVGSKVTKAFKPGDRIAGMTHGSNGSQLEDGAFAEYIVAKGDLQLKTPDNISDEEAATLGVGISTVAQGLYQALKLPLPTDAAAVEAAKGTPILIYGGSTATGLLGIQFAKLSGFKVLTTSSPSNFDYLRSLGADEVYDYKAADWVDKVRASTGGKLRYAWDCIALEDSAKGCAAALDSDEPGAQYACLLPVSEDLIKGVNPKASPPKLTLAYTMIGEAFKKWSDMPAIPADFEHGKKFWAIAELLLAEGKVKTARPEVDRGGKGLEAVLGGLEDLKAGKVSGAKLVFHV